MIAMECLRSAICLEAERVADALLHPISEDLGDIPLSRVRDYVPYRWTFHYPEYGHLVDVMVFVVVG